MLKECAQHGYFRAESCPVCGGSGRFLMNDRELDHLGRVMTGVLRHFPEKYGLAVDEKGWIPLPTLVQAIQGRHRGYHWLRVHHLVAIAESDPKGRYEVKDDKVRATYGHTVEVSLDLPLDSKQLRKYDLSYDDWATPKARSMFVSGHEWTPPQTVETQMRMEVSEEKPHLANFRGFPSPTKPYRRRRRVSRPRARHGKGPVTGRLRRCVPHAADGAALLEDHDGREGLFGL